MALVRVSPEGNRLRPDSQGSGAKRCEASVPQAVLVPHRSSPGKVVGGRRAEVRGRLQFLEQNLELSHLKLFRMLQHNWQPFDFYCRVCMTLGTSTFLSGLGFYCLSFHADVRFGVHNPDAVGWIWFVFCSVLSNAKQKRH